MRGRRVLNCAVFVTALLLALSPTGPVSAVDGVRAVNSLLEMLAPDIVEAILAGSTDQG